VKRGALNLKLIALLAVLAVGAAVALVLAQRARAEQAAQTACLNQCVQAFGPIHKALDAWSQAKTGGCISQLTNYPGAFHELLDEGFLKALPPNPFGSGTLTELKPDEPARVGGFRYIPVYANYQMKDGTTQAEAYHYLFVLYTPVWPLRYAEAPFAGKLGRVPLYAVGEEQPMNVAIPDKTDKAKSLIAAVKHATYDSEAQAIQRAGY
jgi:hypothetical protein